MFNSHTFPSLLYKSAVRFSVIFTAFIALNGCDQQNFSKQQIEQKTESYQSSRQLLTRGIYANLSFASKNWRETVQRWQQNIEFDPVLRDLFEGLTAYDTAGNVVPAVAESWQTEDNKTWLFTLRENAKWSNGENITASQFVSAWQMLATSKTPLNRYLAYLNLQNAKAVLRGESAVENLKIFAENDRTLRIELDKPTPYLPAMLAHISLLPLPPEIDGELLSNGAYQLILPNTEKSENKLHLQKNPYYWAQEKVAFKQVDYQSLQPQQDISALDLVLRPQINLSEKQQKNLQNLPRLCTYFYLFNLHHPQLANSKVRQALATNMKSPLPVSLQQVSDEFNAAIPLEELLRDSNVDSQHPIKLQLSYQQTPQQQNLAQDFIRRANESELIKIKAQPMTRIALLQNYAQGNFELIGTGWCADYNEPSAFLSLFYSQSPDNKIGYHNAQFDHLLEQAMKTKDDAARLKIYQQAEQQLQQDHLAIPMYQYHLPVYFKASVQGCNLANPTEVIYSKDLFRAVQSENTP